MFNPTNFSDRFTKHMSGFKKAFDGLTQLQADIATEQKAVADHKAKLDAAEAQCENALKQLAPFVGK